MATEIVAKVESQYGQMGVMPQYAVKLEGLVGLASAASETVANYTESPFDEDMVIIEAYMDITTVDAQDADLDIGTSDDAAAAGANDDLFDSPANSAAVILSGLAVGAAVGRVCPVWKAKDTADQSFITAQQNGNVDSSDLVYNLILVCVPKAALD